MTTAEVLGAVLLVTAAAGVVGLVAIAFGIFVLAPRITRALDRPEADEEPGD